MNEKTRNKMKQEIWKEEETRKRTFWPWTEYAPLTELHKAVTNSLVGSLYWQVAYKLPSPLSASLSIVLSGLYILVAGVWQPGPLLVELTEDPQVAF